MEYKEIKEIFEEDEKKLKILKTKNKELKEKLNLSAEKTAIIINSINNNIKDNFFSNLNFNLEEENVNLSLYFELEFESRINVLLRKIYEYNKN